MALELLVQKKRKNQQVRKKRTAQPPATGSSHLPFPGVRPIAHSMSSMPISRMQDPIMNTASFQRAVPQGFEYSMFSSPRIASTRPLFETQQNLKVSAQTNMGKPVAQAVQSAFRPINTPTPVPQSPTGISMSDISRPGSVKAPTETSAFVESPAPIVRSPEIPTPLPPSPIVDPMIDIPKAEEKRRVDTPPSENLPETQVPEIPAAPSPNLETRGDAEASSSGAARNSFWRDYSLIEADPSLVPAVPMASSMNLDTEVRSATPEAGTENNLPIHEDAVEGIPQPHMQADTDQPSSIPIVPDVKDKDIADDDFADWISSDDEKEIMIESHEDEVEGSPKPHMQEDTDQPSSIPSTSSPNPSETEELDKGQREVEDALKATPVQLKKTKLSIRQIQRLQKKLENLRQRQSESSQPTEATGSETLQTDDGLPVRKRVRTSETDFNDTDSDTERPSKTRRILPVKVPMDGMMPRRPNEKLIAEVQNLLRELQNQNPVIEPTSVEDVELIVREEEQNVGEYN